MGALIGLLVGKSIFGHVIGPKLARFLAYAGLFLTIAGMIGGVVLWIRSDAVSDHQAKLEHRAAPAIDKAADERAKDTIHQSQNEKEAHDAIQAQPDQPISPTSRALACRRLSNAGKHPPSCRGFESGH